MQYFPTFVTMNGLTFYEIQFDKFCTGVDDKSIRKTCTGVDDKSKQENMRWLSMSQAIL